MKVISSLPNIDMILYDAWKRRQIMSENIHVNFRTRLWEFFDHKLTESTLHDADFILKLHKLHDTFDDNVRKIRTLNEKKLTMFLRLLKNKLNVLLHGLAFKCHDINGPENHQKSIKSLTPFDDLISQLVIDQT